MTSLEFELEQLDIGIDDEDDLKEIDELILTDASISIFEHLSIANQNYLTSKLLGAGYYQFGVGLFVIYYNLQLLALYKQNWITWRCK